MTPTTPPGRTVAEGTDLRLEFVRTIEAPVEQVWSALTDPDRTPTWIGTWTGDPTSGAVTLTMTAEDGAGPQSVLIEACDPPTRLVVGVPGPDGTWQMEVVLTTEVDATRLELTQPLGEEDDPTSIGPGWHFYLDRLTAEVAGATPPDAWDDYYPALRDAYAAP